MSLHSHMDQQFAGASPKERNMNNSAILSNAPIASGPARKLGHPGAVRSEFVHLELNSNEDTIKREGARDN